MPSPGANNWRQLALYPPAVAGVIVAIVKDTLYANVDQHFDNANFVTGLVNIANPNGYRMKRKIRP